MVRFTCTPFDHPTFPKLGRLQTKEVAARAIEHPTLELAHELCCLEFLQAAAPASHRIKKPAPGTAAKELTRKRRTAKGVAQQRGGNEGLGKTPRSAVFVMDSWPGPSSGRGSS